MTCSLQDGKTALHLAAEKGHTEVVDILVKDDVHVYMDLDTKDMVRLVIDACAYLYLCFKGVIIILSKCNYTR